MSQLVWGERGKESARATMRRKKRKREPGLLLFPLCIYSSAAEREEVEARLPPWGL